MKRMKMMSVAVFAALALSVGIGAASASASGFLSEAYPANLSGAPTTHLWMQTYVGFASCNNVSLTGEVAKPTKSVAGSLPSEFNCSAVKAKTNGCKLNLKPGAETAEGVFAGTAEIAAGCSGISFNYYGCTFNFPPQGGLSATFENVGSGSTAGFNVSLSGSKLSYTTTGPAGCLPGSYSDGQLSGKWSATAQSAEGNQTGVHVAHQIGFHMAGDPEKQPRFEAEGYPAGIIGEPTSQHVLSTSVGNLKCNTFGLTGTMTAVSSALPLDPDFRGCSFTGIKPKIRTNTCNYTFTVAKGPAGPHGGPLDLACTGSNQLEIEFTGSGGTCLIKLPPQTIAATSYETTGVGSARKVLAQMAGEGIEYSINSGCEATPGTYNDATLSGSSTLEALL